MFEDNPLQMEAAPERSLLFEARLVVKHNCYVCTTHSVAVPLLLLLSGF